MRNLVALAALASCAAATPLNAQPKDDCTIEFSGQPYLLELLGKKGLDFEGFESLCTTLKSKGLGIDIDSQMGVANNRSFGSANVRVRSIKSQINGPISYNGTAVSIKTTKAAMEDSLMSALNQSLAKIAASPEDYIASQRDEEARLKAFFAPPPKK